MGKKHEGKELSSERLSCSLTLSFIARYYFDPATGYRGVKESVIEWIESLESIPEEREYGYREAMKMALDYRRRIERVRRRDGLCVECGRPAVVGCLCCERHKKLEESATLGFLPTLPNDREVR